MPDKSDKQTLTPEFSRQVNARASGRNTALLIGGVIVLIAAWLYFENSAGSADVTTTDQPPTAVTTAINETVSAGEFTLKVTEARHGQPADNLPETDAQYIVISVSITNDDSRPRDISSNLFTLVDGQGREYGAADVMNEGYLVYETVNPGLTRAYTVAFETPSGIEGLTLRADSGVLLAGGETVTVDLNM